MNDIEPATTETVERREGIHINIELVRGTAVRDADTVGVSGYAIDVDQARETADALIHLADGLARRTRNIQHGSDS